MTTLDQIQGQVARLRTAHPDLTADLDRIDQTAAQLAHWLPRAQALTSRGDGLRSPSLEPHRGGGGHGDPVASVVEADWGEEGKERRGHAGRLDKAHGCIRFAGHALTEADTDASGYGTAGGHVGHADRALTRALSLVLAVMGKSYDRRDIPRWPACTNCHQHGHTSPAAPDRGGLCWWCADVRRALGAPPDADLAEKHQAGRIPKRDYDAFEERNRVRRAKQRKRKVSRR